MHDRSKRPVNAASAVLPKAPVVMIMAGGTGGHIFPGIAVAKRLQALGAEIVWLGSKAGLEMSVVPAHGFELCLLDISGVRGKGLSALLRAPLQLSRAIAQSCRLIRQRQPACLLGMGGFASGPGGLAAWLMRRPLVLHEQNAVPGTTNRWLARLAVACFEGFRGAFGGTARQSRWIGNPVRVELEGAASRRRANLGAGGRSLLILGGSRGAQVLNEVVPQAIALIEAERRPQILHQAGAGKAQACRAAYDAAGVEAEVVEFVDDMAGAYEHASLAICRAGALTIAELAASGTPSVLVPYPFATDDHQTRNAETLVAVNAAKMMQQKELDAKRLAAQLKSLLANSAVLESMSRAAETLARPDAAGELAEFCWSLCMTARQGGRAHV